MRKMGSILKVKKLMEEAMSFISSSQKHFALSPEHSQNLLLDTVSYLFKLPSEEVTNKTIVSFLRNSLTKDYNISIPQQKMYEILSQSMGLKNYNVALSQKVDFKELFFEELSTVLNHVFVGGYTTTFSGDTIPTGLRQLDIDLKGGLGRGQVTTVLSPANLGKSTFCQSIAANALRSNNNIKVLHICLEGTMKEATLRYCTNLNNKTSSEVLKNLKSSINHQNLQNYKQRLMVVNKRLHKYTIEALISDVKEIYKFFPFDLLVVDYPQLLSAEGLSDYRFTMARVYRGLHMIAQDCNCALLAPAQSGRNLEPNQEILRSINVAESFEISRSSSVILTLNKNQEDEKNQTIRVFLEKSRFSEINHKIFTVKTNYPGCNLIAD